VPRIIELVKTCIPQRFGLDPIRDIQVLCPMNRGGAGARSLNIELQAALNPAGDRMVERFGWTFAPGDKVMQIENDYDKEVYNGDIGYINDVDPDAGELTTSFDGRAVVYGFGELDTLVPAYAATIHKSQGSEYPAVVIPVMTHHYAMLQEWLAELCRPPSPTAVPIRLAADRASGASRAARPDRVGTCYTSSRSDDCFGWKADWRLRMCSAEWLTQTYRRGDPGRDIVSCAASQCGIMPRRRLRDASTPDERVGGVGLGRCRSSGTRTERTLQFGAAVGFCDSVSLCAHEGPIISQPPTITAGLGRWKLKSFPATLHYHVRST
jgi:hypothetical protein